MTSYQYYHAALNIADDRSHELDDQEEGVRSGPGAVGVLVVVVVVVVVYSSDTRLLLGR